MIRDAAKEKNDLVFASILDPVKDVRNKEKSRNKPPVPNKTGSFAGSTTFPDSSVPVDGRVPLLAVQAKVPPHDFMLGLNASYAVVVTSLKNVNDFQPNQVKES